MRNRFPLLLLALWVAPYAILAIPQSSSFPLTSDEQAKIGRARNLQADSLTRSRQLNQELQNISLRDCNAVSAVVAEWQKAFRESIIASEQLENLMATLRLKHSCSDCEIAEDGKTFNKPKVKP